LGAERLAANDTITAVDGLTVGHWTDPVARTGCTVVLAPPEGCIASGRALGPAPGSRESVLLEADRTVDTVNAVLLTGGSAFGLAAASGVMRWLEERRCGYETGYACVPIVPAAVIYDLGTGDPRVRPDQDEGRAACEAAHGGPVEQGRVGVGTGATVGKLRGIEHASPSGLGSHAVDVGGAVVAALAVSNAVGNLVDPDDGSLVAGHADLLGLAAAGAEPVLPGANTTLVVVATDAPVTKAQAHALSLSAHVGIARVTRPSHTVMDGDTAFVLSTCSGPRVPMQALSIAVQEVVARALVKGVVAGRAQAAGG
jgi:L-aminopeptidase/D-esterase-like protein